LLDLIEIIVNPMHSGRSRNLFENTFKFLREREPKRS